jgi:hypothetical protein
MSEWQEFVIFMIVLASLIWREEALKKSIADQTDRVLQELVHIRTLLKDEDGRSRIQTIECMMDVELTRASNQRELTKMRTNDADQAIDA